MKVKFPQYKITLVVSINGNLVIKEVNTTTIRSVVNAKKFYADHTKWDAEWESVKVVSVDRNGNQEYDIPTVDLFNMVNEYANNMNKEGN